MSADAPIAAFGQVSMDAVKKGKERDRKPPEPSKYKDFLSSVNSVIFPDGNIDEQTHLEWENIEGEVMAEVLVADLLAGKMFTQIEHPVFKFADPEAIMDGLFAKRFVEVIGKHPHLFPSMTVMKRKVNELMISFQRMGRQEQVQLAQAFSISIQDSERNDAMNKLLKGGMA